MNCGRRGWIFPVVSIVAFPPLIVVVLVVAAARFLAAAVRASAPGHGVRDHVAIGLLVRGGWFGAPGQCEGVLSHWHDSVYTAFARAFYEVTVFLKSSRKRFISQARPEFRSERSNVV